MPMIDIKVNTAISVFVEKQIKMKLGEAIEIIPGKSEEWLMLNFEQNCKMYFKGDEKEPMAFVKVQILGSAQRMEYEQLAASITQILYTDLKINPECIFIAFEEFTNWSWNGKLL